MTYIPHLPYLVYLRLFGLRRIVLLYLAAVMEEDREPLITNYNTVQRADSDDDDDGIYSTTKSRRCNCCFNLRTHAILWSVSGLLLLIIGLIAKPIISSVITSTVNKQVVLDSPSATMFGSWSGQDSKVPVYLTNYMFNVTNLADTLRGARPHVEILGPFNYVEAELKHNISWSSDKKVISYKYNTTYYLVDTPCPKGVLYPDFACSLPDDAMIVTANIPLVKFATLLSQLAAAEPSLSAFVLELLNDVIVTFNEKSGGEGTTIVYISPLPLSYP